MPPFYPRHKTPRQLCGYAYASTRLRRRLGLTVEQACGQAGIELDAWKAAEAGEGCYADEGETHGATHQILYASALTRRIP